jgi:enamine deaminase RidA (YjgF/YER057c/UK114 family)
VHPEERLRQLGFELPPPGKARNSFVGAVRVETLLFVSGHAGGFDNGRHKYVGKLGRDLTVEQGQEVARRIAASSLGTVKAAIGDLGKVRRVVKVVGMINAVEGFGEEPRVLDGASELLIEVFGENGRHARSAVGVCDLAGGCTMLIDMILEVDSA